MMSVPRVWANTSASLLMVISSRVTCRLNSSRSSSTRRSCRFVPDVIPPNYPLTYAIDTLLVPLLPHFPFDEPIRPETGAQSPFPPFWSFACPSTHICVMLYDSAGSCPCITEAFNALWIRASAGTLVTWIMSPASSSVIQDGPSV